MTSDAVLSRELKSLHEALLASRQRRPSQALEPMPTSRQAVPPTAQPEDTGEAKPEHELLDFANGIKEFLGEAERNISSHPAASTLGAVLVGILIGRLLGRH